MMESTEGSSTAEALYFRGEDPLDDSRIDLDHLIDELIAMGEERQA